MNVDGSSLSSIFTKDLYNVSSSESENSSNAEKSSFSELMAKFSSLTEDSVEISFDGKKRPPEPPEEMKEFISNAEEAGLTVPENPSELKDFLEEAEEAGVEVSDEVKGFVSDMDTGKSLEGGPPSGKMKVSEEEEEEEEEESTLASEIEAYLQKLLDNDDDDEEEEEEIKSLMEILNNIKESDNSRKSRSSEKTDESSMSVSDLTSYLENLVAKGVEVPQDILEKASTLEDRRQPDGMSSLLMNGGYFNHGNAYTSPFNSFFKGESVDYSA